MFQKKIVVIFLLAFSSLAKSAIIPVNVELIGKDVNETVNRTASGSGTYNSDTQLLSYDATMEYLDNGFNYLSIDYSYWGSNETDQQSVGTACQSPIDGFCSSVELNVLTNLPSLGSYIFYSNTIDATGNGILTLHEEYDNGNGELVVDYLTVTVTSVPVPAAAWLFSSALISMVGFKRKK